MQMHLVKLPIKVAKEIGSKTYVTNSCKEGHFTHRFVSERSCVVCRRETKKQHMRRKYSDPEYRRELHEGRRQRYSNDEKYRLKTLDACKRYRDRNVESCRRRARDYHHANREKVSVNKRRWYEQNKQHVFKYQKWYETNNREKCQAWKAESSRNRRLRRPSVKSELDQFILEECYHLCDVREAMFGFPWNVDHMIPLQAESVSGLHVWRNLQVIPQWLNYAKKNRLVYTEPLEWLKAASKGET